MSPQLLKEYIAVLKDGKVTHAGLEIPLWYDGDVHMCKLSLVFGMDFPEPTTPKMPNSFETSGPGGWKQPSGLDESQLTEPEIP